MLLGAIDVGTNSIHLIVVELDPRFGTSRTILKAREMVRLGGGESLARGHLSKKAVQRGVAAIARFAAVRAPPRERLDVSARLRRRPCVKRRIAMSFFRRRPRDQRRGNRCARRRRGGAIDSPRREPRLSRSAIRRRVHLRHRRGLDRVHRRRRKREPFCSSTACGMGSLRLYEEYLTDERAPLSLGYRALDKHSCARNARARSSRGWRTIVSILLIGTSGTVLGLAALDAAENALALAAGSRVHVATSRAPARAAAHVMVQAHARSNAASCRE